MTTPSLSPSPEFLQTLRYVAAWGFPESQMPGVLGEWERNLYMVAETLWRNAYYAGVLAQTEEVQKKLDAAEVSGAVEMVRVLGREKPAT